jgi:hypothetical protein
MIGSETANARIEGGFVETFILFGRDNFFRLSNLGDFISLHIRHFLIRVAPPNKKRPAGVIRRSSENSVV